jgi:hypothetical protein
LVNIPVGQFNAKPQVMPSLVSQLVLQELNSEDIERLLRSQLNPGSELITDINFKETASIGDVDYVITWSSNNPAISDEGVITRPEVGEDDVVVKLTAVVKNAENETVATLEYEVTVLAKSDVAEPRLLYSYDFIDGGSSNNNAYANTDLSTDVSYANDNPGGAGTTAWVADYANLSLDYGTRLGGKLESTEYGNPSASIRSDFKFNEVITKVEILEASTFGTEGNVETIYLQTSTDGTNWTTIGSTTTKTGTISFDNLNISAGSYIKIVVGLKASTTNSGLSFKGLQITGFPG